MTDDDLLACYQQELAYLRRMGSAFARRYEKVARRLELGPEESADPNVERLIESFAFLTARLQYRLDAEFPEITTALLDILYPQFLAPVPSMAIARFDVDPVKHKPTTNHTVPKGTPLFAEAEQGQVCRFRTCYPVTLWPVAVTRARLATPDQLGFDAPEAAAVLRLDLAGTGQPLGTYDLRRLRVFLKADPMTAGALYELLICHTRWVGIRPPGARTVVPLPGARIAPVGFGLDEDVLPYPPQAQPAYRLLQEYFEFPEKFMFLDIEGLNTAGLDRTCELVIGLDSGPRRPLPVSAEQFVLGCTPVINLFRKISEPVRLSQRVSEYPLVGDQLRERTTEIHSVLGVTASVNPREGAAEVAPFYSFSHDYDGRAPSIYWLARRQPTGRADLPGTAMALAFLDTDMRPATPALQTVFARTLCTNRLLAEQLPPGAPLQIEEAPPIRQIVCLTRPTAQRTPALGGSTAWRLISQLSLNHLSLSGGEQSLAALREILRLHGGNPNAVVERQIQAIRAMECRPTVGRVGGEVWRGFVRGTEIAMELDERELGGGTAFLLASVLNHFFALYASTNAFTRLVLKSTQRSGIWKAWDPMIGTQAVL